MICLTFFFPPRSGSYQSEFDLRYPFSCTNTWRRAGGNQPELASACFALFRNISSEKKNNRKTIDFPPYHPYGPALFTHDVRPPTAPCMSRPVVCAQQARSSVYILVLFPRKRDILFTCAVGLCPPYRSPSRVPRPPKAVRPFLS